MTERGRERKVRWGIGREAAEANNPAAGVVANPKQHKLLDLQRQAGNAAVQWGVQRWDEEKEVSFDAVKGVSDPTSENSVGSAIEGGPAGAEGKEPINEKGPPESSVLWGGDEGPQAGLTGKESAPKYTMFMPDGVPLRATVDVKMKEASSGGLSKDAGDSKASGGTEAHKAPSYGKEDEVEDPKAKWRR